MKKALIALIALAVVSPVLAQEGPPPAAEAAYNQVVRFLQLDEEQAAAWEEIYWIHKDAEKPLQEAARAVQAEIDELLAGGGADPAELGVLVLERHAIGQELREVHRIYHEDFMALLTEDQAHRLGFIRRADEVQRIIPAFKLLELIPRR